MFIQAYQTHVNTVEFNMNIMSAIITIFGFTRMLLAFSAFETLGPIITTIIFMFNDVAVFIVIWGIVVIMFTTVGIVGFQEIVVLSTFETAIVYWVQAGIGSYDISIFNGIGLEETAPNRRLFGIFMILLFVILNVLILLNVVIAMMADTYAVMTSVRRGVYNLNILKVASAYKPDKYYGGLIVLMPPLSIFSFVLLPIYTCISNRDTLESFNRGVFKTIYAVFLIPLSALFLALNLVMLPFAYLKTCYFKIRLTLKGRIEASEIFVYIVIGLPVLIFTQVTDLWDFLKLSFSTRKPAASDDTFVISLAAFI